MAGKINMKSFWHQLRTMLGYNAANILFGGSTYIISLFFMSYLTEVEGLNTKQAGWVFAFAHIWDAITDPAMGLITDRTKSKFGKHRRYLIWGIAPIFISYFLLWNSFGLSQIVSTNVITVYYTCAYMLFNTAYTLVCVPYTAMLPEIAPEYSLRTQYKSVEYIFNSVGMVSSFVLVSAVLGFTDVKTLEATPEIRSKFLFMGLVLSLFFSLPLLITFFSSKEKDSRDIVVPPVNFPNMINEYKLVFKNKSFRQYFALSTFYSISKGFYNNSNQYFIKHAAKRWNKYNILNTVAGVAEASGFPINYALTMKYGKQLCGKLLGPIMIVGLAISLFVNESTPTWVLYLASVLYCFGFSGVGFVGTNTQPDVTDVDELITGRRREGVISTFSSLIKKTINGLMAALTGYILAAFGFHTGEGAVQTTMGMFGIKFTYSILPIIFALLSIIGIYRYKMTKSDHELIKKAIAEKKETGKAVLSAEERKICEDIAGQEWGNMWIGKAEIPQELAELTEVNTNN